MSYATGITTTRRVLRSSGNRTANALLTEFVTSRHELRWVAVEALAVRGTRQNHLSLLERFRELNNAERQLIGNYVAEFRPLLEELLTGEDASLAAAACRFATYFQMIDMLSTIVRQAATGSHPYADGLAATAMQLAGVIYEQAEAYERDRTLRDPIFERRAAVIELAGAVNRFRDHHRNELVEAFLLLTPVDNPILARVLGDETHAAHHPLAEALRSSPSRSAWELLIRMIEDANSPVELLELSMSRGDSPFLDFVGQTIRLPLPRRVVANLHRVRNVAWLDHDVGATAQLSEESEICLLEMAFESGAPRQQAFELARELLETGADRARARACDVVGRIGIPQATTTLEEYVDDDDPHVAVTAAAALYELGFEEVATRLHALVDHRDDDVRTIARRALRRTTFYRFQSRFDDLSPRQREIEGPIVASVDPNAVDLLNRELQSAGVQRRLRAIAIAEAMQVVDDVLDRLVPLAAATDAAVRAAAVEVLSRSLQPHAIAAVETALHDARGSVRDAAQESRRKMESAGVDAALFDAIRAHTEGEWP